MVKRKTSNKVSLLEDYERMYLTEWLEVTRHSRAAVLKLLPEDVRLYDIRPGDKIRTQLQIIRKLPRDKSEESS